jgi:hypothetical protein
LSTSPLLVTSTSGPQVAIRRHADLSDPFGPREAAAPISSPQGRCRGALDAPSIRLDHGCAANTWAIRADHLLSPGAGAITLIALAVAGIALSARQDIT